MLLNTHQIMPQLNDLLVGIFTLYFMLGAGWFYITARFWKKIMTDVNYDAGKIEYILVILCAILTFWIVFGCALQLTNYLFFS